MDDPVALIIGFVAVMVAVVVTSTCTINYWHTEAVAHGYARFEQDHSFHWNDDLHKQANN